MFYGFRAPDSNDVVFKVSGSLEELRFLDNFARHYFHGAVQSYVKDGVRSAYVDWLEWFSKKATSFAARCRESFWLRPLAWLAARVAAFLGYRYVVATINDFNARAFEQDTDGNYILMLCDSTMEHIARSVAGQLGLRVVSEHFPEGCLRRSKPEKTDGSSTAEVTIGDKTRVLDISGQ